MVKVDADCIVIDIGAGISYNVVDFAEFADLRVGVMTPQLTSLQNAYSFFKSLVYRTLQHTASNYNEEQLYKESLRRKDTDRIERVLARIGSEDPELVRAMRSKLMGFGGYIIGNQLEAEKQFSVLHAMARMLSEFLSIDATVLGGIPRTRDVHTSINQRTPLLVHNPDSPAAQVILQFASQFLNAPTRKIRKLRELANLEREQRVARNTIPAASFPPSLSPSTSGEHKISSSGPPLPATLDRFTRKDSRYPVDLRATAKQSGASFTVQLIDVSKRGLSFYSEHLLDTHASISIELPDHEKTTVDAAIRYFDKKSRKAGLEFESDILSDETLRQLTGALE